MANNHLWSGSSNGWFDRIVTPLNACSLESSHSLLDKEATTDDEHGAIPVIIGCYQLNEPQNNGSGDNNDDEEKVFDENNDDEHDDRNSSSAKKSSSRSGELRLYSISMPPMLAASPAERSSTSDEPKEHENDPNIRFGEPSCVIEMESGVLDGKWRRRKKQKRGYHDQMFASACASGRIHIHSLGVSGNKSKYNNGSRKNDNDIKSWGLSHVASSEKLSQDDDEAALCLSLAWNDYLSPKPNHSDESNNEEVEPLDQTMIVSSYSNGTIALHDVAVASSHNVVIREIHRWKGHTMFGCPSEVWTCSFLLGDENVILSGADDCIFKSWDIRQTLRPTYKIGPSEFEAGVTSISSHPCLPHIFAVGSYDEYVRVYDHRKMDQYLSKVHVGGGVWRIKWHPSCWEASISALSATESPTSSLMPETEKTHEKHENYGKLLIAAMHGGCRVVNIPALNIYHGTETMLANDNHDYNGVTETISEFTAHVSMAYGADWIWHSGCTEENDVAASCSFYDRQAFLWDCNNLK